MTKLPLETPPPLQENSPAINLRGPGLGGRIRNWFLTGVIVAGPLATTVYIVWWFVDTIDNWVKRLVPVRFWPDSYLPFQLPGLGVVFAFHRAYSVGISCRQSRGPDPYQAWRSDPDAYADRAIDL